MNSRRSSLLKKAGDQVLINKAMGRVIMINGITKLLSLTLKIQNLIQSGFDSIWQLEPCAKLRYLWSMRRSDLCAYQAYVGD